MLAKEHIGGHLPFEVEVFSASLSSPNFLKSGAWNRVTVAVNNTLTPTTIPPGVIERPSPRNPYYPSGEMCLDSFISIEIYITILYVSTV